MKKYIVGLLLLIFCVAPQLALSQGLKNSGSELTKVGIGSGVNTESDLGTTVGGIINVALSLVGLIFLVLMVYAGYLWMTARGEEAPIDKAKDIIKAAIIGLVVTMSAYAITTLIVNRYSTPG